MKRFKVYSALKTPDGTILHSEHRHDYKRHIDKNGKAYMLDGGLEYVRSSVNGDEEFIEIWSDEPFEKVRQYCYRTGYGKPGTKEYGQYKLTFLKDMSDEHLKNSIVYVDTNNPFLPLYIEEMKYRQENNIKIDE